MLWNWCSCNIEFVTIFTNIFLNNFSPVPSVTNKGTKNACSMDRTSTNFLKSATLLRVRNSSNLSFRSRGWTMLTRCSLCGHVMHPAVASSVTKPWLESIRSSSWVPLIDRVRIWTSSKGRTSPNSGPTSAFPKHNAIFLHAVIGLVNRV